MARFIKVENTVVNVDLICAVTERFARERIPAQGGDQPFDDYVSVSKGVNVFFGTAMGVALYLLRMKRLMAS